MPKILRIINRFNLGGPTYNAAYLTRYLAPEFETKLIGGEKDASEASSVFILDKLGLKPTIIPEMKRSINPFNDRAAYRKIKSIIREFKPDIVHTHASKAGTLGRLAAISLKVPAIVHTFHGHVFHSYFNAVKTNAYKNIERRLANKTHCIVAISQKQKEELTDIYKICSAEKTRVVPLGFDLSHFQENKEEKRKKFRKEYNIDENEIAVGILGRLVSIKNHDLFLESIKFVKESSSKKIRAFIIGDGEERANIEENAKRLGIDYIDAKKSKEKATLTFTSWIKDADQVCAGMDIIALTSYNEGTPVSLIEAQAADTPIVTTNVGGVENIVLPGKTALLCSSNNTEEFSTKLLQLIEDEILRLKLSQGGWEHVQHKFHYSRLCDDMRKIYHDLL